MDEMFKQCLFARKIDDVTVTNSVSFATFERLFAKPLLIIAIENALALLEDKKD